LVSSGAAIYNNDYAITQVAYASTAEFLSDKDLYEYFARTCGSDSAQGPALAQTLHAVGITPYIAVVHTTDSYSVSLSNSFSTRFDYLSTLLSDLTPSVMKVSVAILSSCPLLTIQALQLLQLTFP
jgi:ABC-type branched-subunit amino acid transport system substrate-binding protein